MFLEERLSFLESQRSRESFQKLKTDDHSKAMVAAQLYAETLTAHADQVVDAA